MKRKGIFAKNIIIVFKLKQSQNAKTAKNVEMKVLL